MIILEAEKPIHWSIKRTTIKIGSAIKATRCKVYGNYVICSKHRICKLIENYQH